MTYRYLAFIHEEDQTFGVSFPDAPGCITVGDTLEEAMANAIEALALHFSDEQDALPVPRTLDAVTADPDLADQREGAAFIYVPYIPVGKRVQVTMSMDSGLKKTAQAYARDRGTTLSGLTDHALRKILEEG